MIIDSINDHLKTVNSLLSEEYLIGQISSVLSTILKYGGKIMIAGNGGSAADSQHIAAELVGRFKKDRQALFAIALTTDSSILTAIANDYDYESFFSRQISAIGREGDVLWLLSTSGSSPNIIAAAKKAKELKITVVGFTGKTGGKLDKYCDYIIKVDHESSDRIQEVHQLCYHLICEMVENDYTSDKI